MPSEAHDRLMPENLEAMVEAADEIERLRAENTKLLRVMAEAHSVMRQTGWQLAPASVEDDSDGVLELAAAEIEDKFATIIDATSTETEEGRE